jgi:hypothetical protein
MTCTASARFAKPYGARAAPTSSVHLTGRAAAHVRLIHARRGERSQEARGASLLCQYAVACERADGRTVPVRSVTSTTRTLGASTMARDTSARARQNLAHMLTVAGAA